MLTFMEFQRQHAAGSLTAWAKFERLTNIVNRRHKFNQAWHDENMSHPKDLPFPKASADSRCKYFLDTMDIASQKYDALIAAWRAEG